MTTAGWRIEPQKTRGKNANRAARVFLATSCQAALHGAHSCVRFRLFRILSYYSSFFTDIAFVSHFSTYTECTPVRFLFVLLSRSAGFICALFARFQRKFSVNHTKSAYFQRKSRKVSVNLTGNARPSMEKHGGRAPHIFSQHIESI